MLTRRGIGLDNAAALLIATGDNPDQLRSEASFAALCGVSPLVLQRQFESWWVVTAAAVVAGACLVLAAPPPV